MNLPYGNMLQHMAWADRRIAEALRAAVSRTEDADAEAGARTAEAVRLYAHVVSAEMNWLSRIEGGKSLLVPLFPEWTVEETLTIAGTVAADYERLLAQDIDFDRIVVYRNSSGTEFRTPVADILTHVFLHGSYHRGQINARLRQAGAEPVSLDYIVFTRQ